MIIDNYEANKMKQSRSVPDIDTVTSTVSLVMWGDITPHQPAPGWGESHLSLGIDIMEHPQKNRLDPVLYALPKK